MRAETGSDSTGACIAGNMKLLRKDQNLSQEQLSERSGVPRSTIASLERGEGNPTLQVLMGISQGLGVTIAELLAHRQPRAALYTRDSHSRVPYQIITAGKASSTANLDTLRLSPANARYLIIEEIRLKKGEKCLSTPHPPGTEEYFYPIEGDFQLEVGNDHFSVQSGDVLCFDGDQVHSYACSDKHDSARGMSVVVQVPRV